MDERENWVQRNIHWMAFLLVLAIFVIYLITVLCTTWPISSYTVSQAGVFGDSFGVLTSLFSGFGFAGLLIAISYQRRDLGLTKSELRETRKEIEKQHRENNVFQLLRILNDVITQLDVKHRNKKGGAITDISTGRDCFDRYHLKLRNHYKNAEENAPHQTPDQLLSTAYKTFWNNWRKDLGHYFRTLFNIYKYLDGDGFSTTEKKFYGNIVRAQISDLELVVLFHNCLTEHGRNFIPLTEKFKLFDNLPIDLILNPDSIFQLPEGAFGDNPLYQEAKKSRTVKIEKGVNDEQSDKPAGIGPVSQS